MPTDTPVTLHTKTPAAEQCRVAPPPSAVEPMVLNAEDAGRMCGRSEASWWRDHAAGRIPAPVRIGRSTLWRVQELRDWLAAGCPTRTIWQAMRGGPARNGARPR